MMCRKFFRNRRLRKDASSVRTGLVPLSGIRTMAVVIDGAGLRVGESVELIEKFCKSNGIELRLMYVDLRKFNSNFQLLTDPEKTLLRKNLNWYGKPNPHKVGWFVEEPADLYVSLYDSDLFCIRYLSTVVRARFKVGLRDFENDPFNFVVIPPQEFSEENVPAPTDLETVFIKIRDLLGSVR